MLRNPNNLTYRNVILSESAHGGLPVAYWPLDEVNGSTAHDIVAGLDATYNGAVTLGAAGPFTVPQSVIFNATGYAVHPTDFNLTGSFTFECWATWNNFIGGAIPTLFSRVATATYVPQLCVRVNQDTDGLELLRSDVVIASCPLSFGIWYHLAMTYDGTTLRMYRSGALITSAAMSPLASLTANSPAFYIGIMNFAGSFGLGITRGWTGQIAAFGIYNYALAADRIQYHYLAGVNGVYGGSHG